MTPTAYAPVVMDLSQGSEDWHVWRNAGIGSSDAASIMGVSPWTTALRLWELKTGRVQPSPETAAMRRGKDLEAQARREFEFEFDADFAPACLVHGEYPFLKASLDGWSSDRLTVLEIKAPGAKAHAEALAGRVPEYYVPQVQHLLLVSGAQRCHYWSWTPYDGGVLVVAERDEAYIADLLARELTFWQWVQSDTAPEMSPDDVRDRADEAWRLAALDYRRAKAYLAKGEEWEKQAREALIVLAEGQRSAGHGVKVTPSTRQGAVDYKAAGKELADILGEPFDFERFRKPAIETVVITVTEKDA